MKTESNVSAFEQIPYLLHGVDWGKHKVLAKNKDGDMLVWLSGGSVWGGMSGTHHCPSDLRIVYSDRTRDGGRTMGRKISEGGRLSKARILAAAEIIDGVFGAGATSQITLKSTVTIENAAHQAE